MTLRAAVANVAWLATGARATAQFHRALGDPGGAQRTWLALQLARHARTSFGREHDFASVRDQAGFARAVPLASYDEVAPWIARICAGETNVLVADRVTHLAPTSGSTGARKLIPMTRGMTRAFDAAVAPWMTDLARQRPRVLGGAAYWSVSPLAGEEAEAEPSAVPIGFADDAEYLGGAAAWLVRHALAVPSSVTMAREEGPFWKLTLLALLRARDLRLISVWHPSFVELLAETAKDAWAELLDAIAWGRNPWAHALPPAARAAWVARPKPARASELRRIGPVDWPRWWPNLQVVSCWGDQAAEPGWRRLAAALSPVLVQPKGLLATEAVVTLPIGGTYPLAVTSHYFEFLDDAGEPRSAERVERGGRYEVVVTNGAGLWRYRLGDVVECTGHLRATPTFRFLGRGAQVSDLRGEKLSEPFVAEVLRGVSAGWDAPIALALRAWQDGMRAGYEVVVPAGIAIEAAEVAQRVERGLCANPHYALARRLGQLSPVRVVSVAAAATDAVRLEARDRGVRLGEVKPRALVPLPVDR